MIDMSKKYKTRGGWEARLYANDGAGNRPIHGAVNANDLGWSQLQWHQGGRYSNNGPHDLDLIEVKPERWYPVYIGGPNGTYWMGGVAYPTKEVAMSKASAVEKLVPIDAWKAPE